MKNEAFEKMLTLQRVIYLDYQSTTPCDARVVDKMMPYFSEKFGNPHSYSHIYGVEAHDAVELARHEIASLIGAEDKDVIFTSGATESNNIAIKGVVNFYKSEKKNHIITCSTEHKCVIEICKCLGFDGIGVTFLPVESSGLIDLNLLENAISDKTILVSIMAVNNEIGVIQPIKEIGKICRKHGVFFHTDAAQALGKISFDVENMNIDLMSLSGHKVYGPKGIGALYVRRDPRVRIRSIISGGGQERGMRSGTLPTPLCVGFGEACRIYKSEMLPENERIRFLRNKMWNRIMAEIPVVSLNGDYDCRIFGNLNINFAGVEGESLMMGLKGFAISSGSACTSKSLESSHVLKAIGIPKELSHSSLRICVGRFTKEEEIDLFVDSLKSVVQRLRDMSPMWEMIEAGKGIFEIKS